MSPFLRGPEPEKSRGEDGGIRFPGGGRPVELPDPEFFTLAEAQQAMLGGMDKGTYCPCCGRYAKVYRRKLTSAMARDLIYFYRHSVENPGWFHALTVLNDFRVQRSDYDKLVHWGFLEKKGEAKEDGNPSSGYFRITQRGCDFVEGRLRVPSHIQVFHKEFYGYAVGGTVSIREALENHFNYDELMST
jgi:hypothetical protein